MKFRYAPLALVAALALSLTAASAQTPTADAKALHIVIPFTVGGAQDAIGRYLGNKLATRLGVPVIIDNKAGAGGVIAADAVAKSLPDGNTLLLATGGAISIAPHLNPKLPYDVKRDFTAVAMLADTPMTLGVRSQSPYTSVADVLRDAKARPGQVTFASTGNGTVSHLTGELFAQTAGVQLLHVPYRGAGPAMTDLLGGQVALVVTSATSIDPMVEGGKARVLASFTSGRMPTLRGAPTMNEAAGIKGLEVPVWVGLLAPSKTPAAQVEKLSAEILAICNMPETRAHFRAVGAVPTCGGSKELAKVVTDDLQRWSKVIRQGNIKAE
ncbi:Tripartite-type tricarboxylate transporter, receptor component TctC [Polaromonas sp. OV174]|uniref:Bug family tripartite tricarboxylate transporter substrate binding protein n=1 Tax=Polaromonas sp. OV174 TaxID=1855300 RepID=UPI0008E2B75F|nr:tripartite tricarboxylate transporter substrate-binding protein [Polaromonas sp. OV174]SFB84214.1 Tripartite-type tricarboxylate transporter, receptor component TctC [Polaromonas sp. OV174]